jgi:hypothetical protein
MLPDSVFDEMNTRFRSSPKFYDRESVAEMFAGSPIEQRQRKQEWTDGIATFQNLVAHYGNRVADLEHMSRIPDQAAKALLDGIARIQAGEMEAEPSERLTATLRDRFIASLREDIARLADRYKFNKDDAETIVRDDALRALPSASVVVSLFREHYRRHVGPIGKVRKADANDVMDMHHLRSLPYVDFQATDAFWADCARGTAKNFGTRLTKNTVDLLAAVNANL